MWIFLVAPKQRPTFPSNRNNLGRGALSAASLQHPRSPAVSLERVYVLTRRSVAAACRRGEDRLGSTAASEEFVIGDLSCNVERQLRS